MDIAVIPARGGSKRIPRKNIKIFNGKPMIAYAIEVAINSKLFDKVIISSDDEEIISIGKKFGAEIIFKRPLSLSSDETPTAPVIAHAISECGKLGWTINNVCCIYPSVPFLNKNDLIEAFDIFTKKNADFVYPITEYPHPVQRAMRIGHSGKMEFLNSENELKNTQDLETTYHDTGQFYWGSVNSWSSQKKMHSNGLGMVVPSWRFIDIDTPDDWIRAEIMYGVINKK